MGNKNVQETCAEKERKMSRVDFGAKPLMYPMPVLIIGTYDENGVPDAMNAAWGIYRKYCHRGYGSCQ